MTIKETLAEDWGDTVEDEIRRRKLSALHAVVDEYEYKLFKSWGHHIVIRCEPVPAADRLCGIAKKAKPPNRYMPHQGKREKERRKKRMEQKL